MPDQRFRLAFRIFIHRHPVTGIDIPRTVGYVDHVPVLSFYPGPGMQTNHKRAHEAGAGIQQRHVIIRDTIGITSSPDPGLTTATLVIPAGTATFKINHGIGSVRHPVHEELVLRTVTAYSAGFRRQCDGLPLVVGPRREILVAIGIGQQRVGTLALIRCHRIIGTGRRRQVTQGSPESIIPQLRRYRSRQQQ